MFKQTLQLVLVLLAVVIITECLEDETQQEFVSDQQGSEHFYRPFGGFGGYRRYGGFGGFGGFGGYRRFGGYGPYGGYRPYGGYGWGR